MQKDTGPSETSASHVGRVRRRRHPSEVTPDGNRANGQPLLVNDQNKFLLPASLIVINDIAAYLFGFFLGRTPLIKLSPKKTWEGFIGASVTTIISAFLVRFFSKCNGPFPVVDMSKKGDIHLLQNLIFPWKEVALLPVQWHALALGLFASIIAPFGGFFASGFKRAFKIKDFGDSIPGHGGITDRMDCQIIRNLTYEEQKYLYQQLGEIFRERQLAQS
ncbi:hypothetical protein PR202_gb04697 [Eleusine coracana subsp. coracana]|uniref:Phosphatidate cytidylyltransferase n=1 Tax=Eleusine coracana subsp. coracana TaxID=191504 RepID=A0AAV5E506_ELECO|nr:hypothetical protein PR202_gb04697 [Eleusine coracana subsp. coracana]